MSQPTDHQVIESTGAQRSVESIQLETRCHKVLESKAGEKAAAQFN
jgi:hypothetical protein